MFNQTGIGSSNEVTAIAQNKLDLIKKYATVTEYSQYKTIEEIEKSSTGLEKGDILVYGTNDHMNVYAGKDKQDNYLWYDSGIILKNGGYASDGKYYFKTFGPVKDAYSRKVRYLIRLKTTSKNS